jgi:hypothetical protein
VADRADASVEFLGFLAHISCPATGEIGLEGLAGWLGLAADELESRWVSSGTESWADFASDILSVLDIMQDHTFDLALTLAWYRHDALPGASDTADKWVSAGRVAQVRHALRNRKLVRVPDGKVRAVGTGSR